MYKEPLLDSDQEATFRCWSLANFLIAQDVQDAEEKATRQQAAEKRRLNAERKRLETQKKKLDQVKHRRQNEIMKLR